MDQRNDVLSEFQGKKKNEDKIFERINYLIKQQVELANIGSSNMEKEIQ